MNDHRSTRAALITADSKRSWFVCLGAAVMVGASTGMANNFGVFFVSLLDEFHRSRRETAWVGSLLLTWYFLISPLSNHLTNLFGFRKVVIVGSVLYSLGLLLSSFAHDIWVLYLTYGLLLGTGTSFLFVSGLTVLLFCFQRHLATASGIVVAANSVFTMCIGPMNEYLIRCYGLRITLRLLALWIVPLAVACVLFPSKTQIDSKVADENSNNTYSFSFIAIFKRLLKDKAFLLWFIVMILVYLAIYVPYLHLISFCEDIGISIDVSVYSISCISLFDAVGKLAFGRLLDRFQWDVFKVNSLAILTMAISMTLLPIIGMVYQLFVFSAFFGLGLGIQSLLVVIISPRLSHPRDAKQAVTYVFMVASIPGGVGPTVAAWIYDSTHSYQIAFFISGGLLALASCLSVVLPLLKNTWEEDTDVCRTKEIVEPMNFVATQPFLNDETKFNNHMERWKVENMGNNNVDDETIRNRIIDRETIV